MLMDVIHLLLNNSSNIDQKELIYMLSADEIKVITDALKSLESVNTSILPASSSWASK
ncbi:MULTISPECIES: hypothetical protein [Lysinibacillus]|uniref:hypothetical protein n=1 Tax=Lysinibacillus TaxID=400634 RepID=UPI0001DA5B58|nr:MULTISPECIES: hypothetical protein [Lysinibacillus]EFI66967.1 hypothetical protein BFZC1_19250 [Lysinibacillus fusiformis ZC1]EKU44199.1 hypothetical protein C518_0837 [Lysinibacillus fusiformis ZB2]MBU5254576.1 hypothetical protein [Lysinibacillus capsici]MBX8945189.1 hypothetical protein [Lysinibacillus sp. K60]MED4701196.1 hypothetical protein [Lysinibacillus capsici]